MKMKLVMLESPTREGLVQEVNKYLKEGMIKRESFTFPPKIFFLTNKKTWFFIGWLND